MSVYNISQPSLTMYGGGVRVTASLAGVVWCVLNALKHKTTTILWRRCMYTKCTVSWTAAGNGRISCVCIRWENGPRWRFVWHHHTTLYCIRFLVERLPYDREFFLFWNLKHYCLVMKLLSVIDKWRLRSRDQDMVGTFATVWLGLIRQSLVLLDSEPLINVQKKILSCVHLDRHGRVVGSPGLLIAVGEKMHQIYTTTSKSVRNSIGKIDFSFLATIDKSCG